MKRIGKKRIPRRKRPSKASRRAKPTNNIARHTRDAIYIREEQLDPSARYL